MAVAELFFSHEEHSDVSSPAGGWDEDLDSVDGFLRPGQGYRPDVVIFQEPTPLP